MFGWRFPQNKNGALVCCPCEPTGVCAPGTEGPYSNDFTSTDLSELQQQPPTSWDVWAPLEVVRPILAPAWLTSQVCFIDSPATITVQANLTDTDNFAPRGIQIGISGGAGGEFIQFGIANLQLFESSLTWRTETVEERVGLANENGGLYRMTWRIADGEVDLYLDTVLQATKTWSYTPDQDYLGVGLHADNISQTGVDIYGDNLSWSRTL